MTDGSGDDRGLSDEQRAARRQGLAYQGATEAVVAVLVAVGLGYLADKHFESSPLCLLIGGAVGFAAMVLRLIRLGRQLYGPAESKHGDSA